MIANGIKGGKMRLGEARKEKREDVKFCFVCESGVNEVEERVAVFQRNNRDFYVHKGCLKFWEDSLRENSDKGSILGLCEVCGTPVRTREEYFLSVLDGSKTECPKPENLIFLHQDCEKDCHQLYGSFRSESLLYGKNNFERFPGWEIEAAPEYGKNYYRIKEDSKDYLLCLDRGNDWFEVCDVLGFKKVISNNNRAVGGRAGWR